MRMFAAMPALEVWYAHAEATEVQARLRNELDKSRRRNLKRTMAKARTKDNLGAMSRFAGMLDGQPRIIADPPLIVPLGDLLDDQMQREEVEQGLRDIIAAYRATLEPERRVLLDQYRLVDFARKVVGVGVVGTRSWMALLLGDNERDPLFLQAKEAGPSVLEAVRRAQRVRQLRPAGRRRAAAHAGGQRHLPRLGPGEGHRRSDRATSTCASCGTGRVRPRSRRWRRPGCRPTASCAAGRSPAPTRDPGIASPSPRTSARVRPSTPRTREFASTYADQNERDYRVLVDAIAAGRIAAIADV